MCVCTCRLWKACRRLRTRLLSRAAFSGECWTLGGLLWTTGPQAEAELNLGPHTVCSWNTQHTLNNRCFIWSPVPFRTASVNHGALCVLSALEPLRLPALTLIEPNWKREEQWRDSDRWTDTNRNSSCHRQKVYLLLFTGFSIFLSDLHKIKMEKMKLGHLFPSEWLITFIINHLPTSHTKHLSDHWINTSF